MIESSPWAKRDVEQAERGDRALDLAGQAAALQPHAVADPERPRGDQHHAGDQVAERLLGGEAEDDGGDRHHRRPACAGPARRSAARTSAGDGEEREPDQERDRPGRARVDAAEQRRLDPAAEVARQRPAEDHQHDRRRHAHGRVDAEQLLAHEVGDDRRHGQRDDEQQLPPRRWARWIVCSVIERARWAGARASNWGLRARLQHLSRQHCPPDRVSSLRAPVTEAHSARSCLRTGSSGAPPRRASRRRAERRRRRRPLEALAARPSRRRPGSRASSALRSAGFT